MVSRLVQDEGVVALRALIEFFSLVRLLVIYHVAEFWCLNWALQTLEELICSACLFINHIAFFEAHVACIATIFVPYSLLDDLMSRGV